MAGPIAEEVLAEILRRANIVDVIAEHVQLRKVGSGFQGICPFHQESKPSFHVNEARQFFHCFGCGAGGNSFHFLMRFHQLTFPEAVRLLAARYGVDIPERPMSPEQRRRKAERESLFEANDLASAFFREQLQGDRGGEARRYLKQRGISREMTEAFCLGYAPAEWRLLVNHLRRKSVSLELAERAGLIIPTKEGRYYDRFRGRLIFPIHDEGGRIVGFGGRSLEEATTPKYLNSPESPLFSKGRVLYGLHRSRGAIREADAVVVVEGYTDLIALHQYGVRNAVATLGTALTVEHLHILRRYTSNVVHVFDADEAGDRATIRALDLSLEAGVWGRVMRLPLGEDPDSYVRKAGGETFQSELRDAVSLMDFWICAVLEQVDVSRAEEKIRALEQILPRVRRLPHRVAVDHYAAMLADRLRIPESSIHRMLKEGDKVSRRRLEEMAPADPHRAEKLLIQAIIREPSLARCLHNGVLDAFQDPRARMLGLQLAKWSEIGDSDGMIPWLEARIQEPDSAGFLAQLLAGLEQIEDPERVCEDCLKHIKRKGLEREIRLLEEEIHRARRQKDTERLKALEAQKLDLVLRKARLRMSA